MNLWNFYETFYCNVGIGYFHHFDSSSVKWETKAWKFWKLGQGKEGRTHPMRRQEFSSNRDIRVSRNGPSSCILLEIGPSVRHDWKIIRVDCSVASFSFSFSFFASNLTATGVAKQRFESSSINWGKRKNIKKKKKRKRRERQKKRKNARYTWRFLISILPRLMWFIVSWKRPDHSRLF